MKRILGGLSCAAAGVLALLLSACSREPMPVEKKTWYEQSKDGEAVKAARIKAYMDQGLTFEQARDAWWSEEVKLQTETGGRGQSFTSGEKVAAPDRVDGAELDQALQRRPPRP